MRILIGYFVDGKHSGIDKYLLNFINTIKSEDIYIDILTSNSNQEFMEQYKKYNVNTIIIPRLRNLYKQYKTMNEIFKENFYDISYFNISETFNAIGIYSAYKNKIKKIIVHSHASDVDIRNPVKRFILQELNQLVNQYFLENNQKKVGNIEKVLVEGKNENGKTDLYGYTETNKLINFNGSSDIIGKIVDVKVIDAKTWSLDGEICE